MFEIWIILKGPMDSDVDVGGSYGLMSESHLKFHPHLHFGPCPFDQGNLVGSCLLWGNACRCRLVFVWEEKFKSPAWVSMQIVSCGLVWRDNEGASIWVLPDGRWINFNNSFHVALASIACERCTFFLDLPFPILLLIRPYGDRYFHQSTNVTLVSRAKLGLNALTPKSSHVPIGFIVCNWIH